MSYNLFNHPRNEKARNINSSRWRKPARHEAGHFQVLLLGVMSCRHLAKKTFYFCHPHMSAKSWCPSDWPSVFLHPMLYFIHYSLRGKESGYPGLPIRRFSLSRSLSPPQRQSTYPGIPSQTGISPVLYS